MTLKEALEADLPLRRPDTEMSYKSYNPLGTVGITKIKAGTWLDPEFLFAVQILNREHCRAIDWQVKTVRQAKKDKGLK